MSWMVNNPWVFPVMTRFFIQTDQPAAHTTHVLAHSHVISHAHTHAMEHTQMQTYIYTHTILKPTQQATGMLYPHTHARIHTFACTLYTHFFTHVNALWSDVLNGEQSLSFPVMRTFLIQTDQPATHTRHIQPTDLQTHLKIYTHTYTMEHTHTQIHTHIYILWSDVLNGEQSLSFPVMRILFIQTDHRATRPTIHMKMHTHTKLAHAHAVEWCLEWWTIPEFSGDENPFYSNWPQTRDT